MKIALALPILAFAQTESLNYAVNWPSGLTLGEGSLVTRPVESGYSIELRLEASIAGFAIVDTYRSTVNQSGCSLAFEKESVHGKRKSAERSTFEAGTLTRQTSGGGKSQTSAGPCPRDALAFIRFLRKELAGGRLPPAQTIYFGAAYQARLQYAGAETITVGESRVEADRLMAIIKGPASELSFEIWFAHDEPRTPLLFKLPLAVGLFSMELVHPEIK